MTEQYIAGTCNIGKNEIRQRQVVALIGLFLSLSSLIGFISTSASQSVRLGIFLPLTVFSIGWVQSRKKFCLAYGFMGTFNFGKLGKVSRVSDKASLAADRKTAVSILLQSLGLASILTLIVYLLPLN
ncbi:hypothetical protein MCEMRE22_01044 [Candidatus Nanopelagicaceae bacterium]|jgi:hypothetical protein|uniref:Unannotated protein n=1 Tax=freshwater metagenome TaxID=449393 RepID=A0A6J7TQV5_9ZZZZ|nr:hypothetical protein [Actinomycetota bacterium]MTA61217.1 hypothetical protein [Actinomycetota bacterium]